MRNARLLTTVESAKARGEVPNSEVGKKGLWGRLLHFIGQ